MDLCEESSGDYEIEGSADFGTDYEGNDSNFYSCSKLF